MSLTLYDASIPVFTRGLTILSTLLDKAEAHASETGAAPESYVEARLAPGTLTPGGQEGRAPHTPKIRGARRAGTQAPSFAGTETTFDQLRARCADTIAYLGTLPPDAFAGRETQAVTFGGGAFQQTLSADRYLLQFALPNFFFHVTTAYDILRHRGVPVGKRDY